MITSRRVLFLSMLLAMPCGFPSTAFAQNVTLTVLSGGANGGGRVTGASGAIDCTVVPSTISGTGQCSAQIAPNSMVTLTATPDSESGFIGWAGTFACPNPASFMPCFYSAERTVTVDIASATTISAQFRRATLTVLGGAANGSGRITGADGAIDCAFAPGAVNGTGACTIQRPPGTVVTLTATPDEISGFMDWHGIFACADPMATMPCVFSHEPTISLDIGDGKILGATFRTATLTVLGGAANGSGRVTGANGAIDCEFAPGAVNGTGACTIQRPPGTAVTLTATPDEISGFTNWHAIFACADPMATTPCVFSLEPTISIDIGGGKTVGAMFRRVTLQVLAGDTGGGTIEEPGRGIACTFGPNQVTGSGVCSAQMPPNTVVTLNATPDATSRFTGWHSLAACPDYPMASVPCLFSSDNPLTLRMDADKTIGARFRGGPHADAGPDQQVAEGTPVTLDGSGSTAPVVGGSLQYTWQQVAGPEVTLNASDTAFPTFSAPLVGQGTAVLTFSLVVNDGEMTNVDHVDVAVNNVNRAPVADAGANQTVSEGSQVTLDGGASYDEDGENISYHWTQVGGTGVTLSDVSAQKPAFTAPFITDSSMTLLFELVVSDVSATSMDVVEVVIENVNHTPTVTAGGDQTVTVDTSVTLTAAASDPDNDSLSYQWSQVAGNAVTLNAADTATATFTAPPQNPGMQETLTFRVTATDTFGAVAADFVDVIVRNASAPPNCGTANPSVSVLWPPNHKLVPVELLGIGGAQPIAVTITSVMQDEPVQGLGDGDVGPDAVMLPSGSLLLRSERAGRGDGRVYHIFFTAIDANGQSCSGATRVDVPHSMAKPRAVDQGPSYNSLRP